jgi:hypothetical protein
MPFKPNYRLQRADRQIAKAQKQQKKLQRRAEKAAIRETGEALPASDSSGGDDTDLRS